jgi:diketogulonate reductase-like aldo/keto reductase
MSSVYAPSPKTPSGPLTGWHSPRMRTRIVQGVVVPGFLYGTAWKEERTEELARAALAAGFRGIDTANQRRHYFEAAVGAAVESTIASGAAARADIFLQTKFTSVGGQDHRLPYDPRADTGVQVRQSFESSLEHLHTDYVDSYVLHGPTYRTGLADEDWNVWRAMESLHEEKKTRLIGVSNVSLDQLAAIQAQAVVKPAFVQNRCYASTGWDKRVRGFCAEHGIVYQGFSLLTANAPVLDSPVVGRAAQRLGRSPEQIIFRFALEVGMLPLTGTTNAARMEEDLKVFDFELEKSEVEAVERIHTT